MITRLKNMILSIKSDLPMVVVSVVVLLGFAWSVNNYFKLPEVRVCTNQAEQQHVVKGKYIPYYAPCR